ncbi:MAG: magnesium transporter CorA family protein [Pseudomonadota bacterium]
MLTVYRKSETGIERCDGEAAAAGLDEAVWIDLISPTQVEIEQVQASMGIAIPGREQMQEIESSSRLRRESHAIYMTVTVLSNVSTPNPRNGAVTFILSRQRLVTLRYSDPLPFKVFGRLVETREHVCDSGTMAMIGLFATIIDRLADVVEMAGQDVEALSAQIFRQADHSTGHQRYDGMIQRIGRVADVMSKTRDSMMSLSRALTFLSLTAAEMGATKDLRNLLKNEARDLNSIADFAHHIDDKITFLLDATLGLIGQQQNTIMMIFSVLAMVFLPPTLIGSIYGMNFKDMPELDWPFGYPLALGLMIMSAILPYWFFKRKGWL